MHARLTTVEAPQDRMDDATSRSRSYHSSSRWTVSRGSSPCVIEEAAGCAVWPSGRVKKRCGPLMKPRLVYVVV